VAWANHARDLRALWQLSSAEDGYVRLTLTIRRQIAKQHLVIDRVADLDRGVTSHDERSDDDARQLRGVGRARLLENRYLDEDISDTRRPVIEHLELQQRRERWYVRGRRFKARRRQPSAARAFSWTSSGAPLSVGPSGYHVNRSRRFSPLS
jgi:hypothetical protein